MVPTIIIYKQKDKKGENGRDIIHIYILQVICYFINVTDQIPF